MAFDTRQLGVIVNDETEDETRTLAAGEEALDGDSHPLITVTRMARDPTETDIKPAGHWWFHTDTHRMWWSHGGGDWTRVDEIPPPTLTIIDAFPEFIDTFVSAPQTGVAPWIVDANQGSLTVVTPPESVTGRSGVVGVLDMSSNALKNGQVGFTLYENLLLFTGATYNCWLRVMIPELGDAADSFNFRIGFLDNESGAPVDGAFFEYDYDQSANWRAATVSASSFTYVDTGISVVAGQWIDLSIAVDSDTPKVDFYAGSDLNSSPIDDPVVATITSNIPTVSGRETSLGARLYNTDGKDAHSAYVDRILLKRTGA